MIEFEFYKKVHKDYCPNTVVVNDKNPNSKDNIRFIGVWDCRKKELAVPIKYTHLTLYDGDIDFNAVVGEEYTDEHGIRSIQYGLIYNGKLVLPCNNKEIQVLSRNLFIVKEQGKLCLIANGKKIGSYSSISRSSILGKKEIVMEESENYKSCKICNYTYYCAILHEGEKVGLYSPDKDTLVEPQFNNILPIIEQDFILADNRLYIISNKSISLAKDMEGYTYIGGIENCYLFMINGEDKYCIDSYIYLWLDKGNWKDCNDIEDVEDYVREDYLEQISKWKYYPIIYVGGYYYSIKANQFAKDIAAFWNESGYSSPDNWNYERDTYYALGGNDYDRWKEEGGDIDSMMDGLGY